MSSVEEKSKITQKDFDSVASYICEEFRRRKKGRRWLDKMMSTVDRQLRMDPEVLYKRRADGTDDRALAWMPECELPNQAQTLEILCADARRMMFPDSGDWFDAKAYANDEFISRFKDNSDFIVGSDIDPPSVISQDNVNEYVKGWLGFVLRQFDHDAAWDAINAEAFKYSLGVGRIRLVAKSVFIHDSVNTWDRSTKIPVLVPVPLKNVYFDDRAYDYMAAGAFVGPSVIMKMRKKYADLVKEAELGDNDDAFMAGGWMSANVAAIKPGKGGDVDLLEYEGDIIFPTNGGDGNSVLVPNVIVTVLYGKDDAGEDKNKIIRIQYSELPSSSYVLAPYHREHIDDPYGTSPLIKGAVIQKAGSESLNRYLQAAILNTQPPISYDRDDQFFRTRGGVSVYPGAQWATSGDIKVHHIGDPTALLAGYKAFLDQYADVTGVNAPRLGAQTVSHTTAYAKDREMERGVVRTVDYVRSVMKGPMVKWLSMAYFLSKKAIDDSVVTAYMSGFNAYVNVREDLLPDVVCFEAKGSAFPGEVIARQQMEMSAIMQAIQINQLAVQAGLAAPLNFEAITRNLLRKAGITDVDAYTTAPSTAQGPAGASGIPGAGQGAVAPNAIPIALQGLQRAIIEG